MQTGLLSFSFTLVTISTFTLVSTLSCSSPRATLPLPTPLWTLAIEGIEVRGPLFSASRELVPPKLFQRIGALTHSYSCSPLRNICVQLGCHSLILDFL